MANPKTRFVVTFENVDRELFSVRENGNLDLTLLLKEPMNYEDPKAGDVRIVRNKFSIHGSPASIKKGTTIVRTLLLANGRKKSGAQFIENSKSSFLTLIYSLLCADLSPAHYLANPRVRDKVIRIGAFRRSDFATLIYHVVVRDDHHSFPPVPRHTLKFRTFQKWKIGVYSTYLDIPSVPWSQMMMPLTSPPRTDDVVVDDPYWIRAKGDPELPRPKALDPAELPNLLTEFASRLAASHVLKLYRNEQLSKEHRNFVLNHPRSFHPTLESLLEQRRGMLPRPRLILPDGLSFNSPKPVADPESTG